MNTLSPSADLSPTAPPPRAPLRASSAGAPPRLRRHGSRTARARLEDASFVLAALAGDRSASQAILRRFLPLVRHCLGRTLSGPDLEDHVQEVFARCFANLGRLRDPSALRSFIIGITLRFASTERRRRRSRSIELLTATGDLPEMRVYQEDLEARLMERTMRHVLDRVRPEGRRALELRFVHENELTEVAASLGVSLATAKRHLSRTSARVRAMALGEPLLAERLRPHAP